MSTPWKTPAIARTHSWNPCPWQNTRSSRLPGVWSAATGGTSERFRSKANPLSWRTSLAWPQSQPLAQRLAVAVGEAQPLQSLAQGLAQAVAVGQAEPLAQAVAVGGAVAEHAEGR